MQSDSGGRIRADPADGIWRTGEYQSGAPDGGGLSRLAPNKHRKTIPDPMRQIQEQDFCEQTGRWRALPACPGICSGWTVYADDYRRDTGA